MHFLLTCSCVSAKKAVSFYDTKHAFSISTSKILSLQANALKLALKEKEVPANVYVAMRYWHPFTEEAVQQASLRKCNRYYFRSSSVVYVILVFCM